MKLNRTDIACALVVAGQLAAALYVAQRGATGPIPMHFDLHGVPNRWGDRAEAARLLAGLGVGTGLIYAMLRNSPATANRPGTTQSGATMVIAVGALIAALATAMGLGLLTHVAARASGWFLMSLLSLLLLGSGVFLGKVAPNPWIGVRTFWTASSRLAWDKANRLAGRIYFWAGLAGLLASPFAPQPLGLQAVLAAAVGGAAAAVFESWRVWRSEAAPR